MVDLSHRQNQFEELCDAWGRDDERDRIRALVEEP